MVNRYTLNVSFLVDAFRSIQVATSRTSNIKKVTLVSVSVGIVLLGVLARYLRRRKRVRLSRSRKPFRRYPEELGSPYYEEGDPRQRSPSIRSLRRQGSVLSGASDVGSRRGLPLDCTDGLTPQQLGVMGMEALETGIRYWEDAMSAYVKNTNVLSLAITNEEESEFCRQLQRLLDAAYKLQDDCELLFLDERSVLFRPDGSTRAGSQSEYTRGDFSPAESFVSAQDEGWQMADMREFDEYLDSSVDIEKLSLYKSAMRHFENEGVPYRCLRTEMVKCSSDVEYLCKLHCVRVSFQWIFTDSVKWEWFVDVGRHVLADLILCAGKDPKEFLLAYEDMMMFLQDESKRQEMELELMARGVKAMTFYDIVLDYILMDAFEDLDTPPSSVLAVVQNRWLSDGFKESALATAVWSVLKAKRRMLKYPNGFMAHFYSISEKLSPLMAWAFLGPNDELRETCQYFKEQVLNFLTDIFSFQKTRYTSVEDLCEDILRHSKDRVDNITEKLTTKLTPQG